jgi:tRNA(Ile)-lysidine synthase
MTHYDPPWLRPLLGLRRSVTRAACAELGVPVWDDPHNANPRFTRVRLRAEVLPLLEEVLAGGVAEALARTAAQLREDCAALDDWAALVVDEVTLRADAHSDTASDAGYTEVAATKLAEYPPSVRRRVLRCWLTNLGVPALTDAQLRRADELVGRWRGQGGLALPGGLVLSRRHERLQLTAQAIRQPTAQPARGDEEEPHVVRR